MAKIYKVSDDGQLITKLTTEEVKAIAREQLANARQGAELTLEAAKTVIAASEGEDCQHICFGFVEAMSFAKTLRELRAACGAW